MKHIKATEHPNQPRFPIALVVSEFNRDITQALQKGALQRLAEKGFSDADITLVEVPGAIEIPLVAQLLAKKRTHAVILVLGAVIRGETSHYDYVCKQVSDGCQHVAMAFDIPVIFKVVTTENETQAWDRVGGKHGHMGIEGVDCAIAMYSILQQL